MKHTTAKTGGQSAISQGGSPEEEDKRDAESLYNLLENEIVPLYYDLDRKGIPHKWIKIVKEAIKTITPAFSACRMMKEYTQQMYLFAPVPPSTERNPIERYELGNK